MLSNKTSSYSVTFPSPVNEVSRPRGNRVPPLSKRDASIGNKKGLAASIEKWGKGKRKPLVSDKQQGSFTQARATFTGPHTSSWSTGPADTHTHRGESPNLGEISHHRGKNEDGWGSTGGGGSVVILRPERDSPRFHLAVQALQEGCIQSFIRFFYLSHRDPVCVNELSQTHFTIPEGRLGWVQQQLSAVEVLRRQSEFREVLHACGELAVYFESEGDFLEAAWHHERALAFMIESLDVSLEQVAREAFARFLQRVGRIEAAAEQYEAMYSLAKAVQDEEKALAVSLSLVTLCQEMGERELRAGNLQTAREYFERCVLRAKRSRYGVEEGSAYEALGHLHEKKGNLYTALEYQKNFRVVAQREKLYEKECQAIMNVASLEDRVGENTQAIASLQEAVDMARKLGDSVKIAKATMNLGEAYRSSMREGMRHRNPEEDGNTSTEVIVRFSESFEAARQSRDMELIDSARVLLGFARGGHYFKHVGNGRGYPDIVCNDVRAQLKWMSTGEL
ncbi:unnamed protein product [Phytomonas sp. Hart1]|nr:unnamed protein product [Phytomonas sp. Hart1]|eukprot:CCW70988.1 unnamed protein product [Phytomonas sp. isolate Hart1]